jgi:hypothetical protein
MWTGQRLNAQGHQEGAVYLPVDPFASSMTAQAQERQRREQGERDAAEMRRTALLSQIGQMFSAS